MLTRERVVLVLMMVVMMLSRSIGLLTLGRRRQSEFAVHGQGDVLPRDCILTIVVVVGLTAVGSITQRYRTSKGRQRAARTMRVLLRRLHKVFVVCTRDQSRLLRLCAGTRIRTVRHQQIRVVVTRDNRDAVGRWRTVRQRMPQSTDR